MGSCPFPFGINFFLVSMRKPIFLVARDQASIPGVNCVLSPKKLWMLFVCLPIGFPINNIISLCLPTKILWETQLFFRWFKTVISSTNSGNQCLSRKCRTYTFNDFSLAKWESRNGGSKNQYSTKLYSTLANCTTIQRTPSQGIVSRDFLIFEGMKKFYYRNSAKKCLKYSFDIRAHLKTERHLCFPTSDRLETWLLPSGPTWSRQYHESTMV